MAVLSGHAHRSGSSRPVKPSISRLATFPGSEAFSQPSIGPNSHSSGLFLPPVPRYLRYPTVSRQIVPTTPARRPPTTAASGVIGRFAVRVPDPTCHLIAVLAGHSRAVAGRVLCPVSHRRPAPLPQSPAPAAGPGLRPGGARRIAGHGHAVGGEGRRAPAGDRRQRPAAGAARVRGTGPAGGGADRARPSRPLRP